VDWSKLGAPAMDNAALYPMVVNSVNSVGDRVAEFIVWLIQNKYLSSPAKVHMIGHSLGSHVSGRAGQVIQAANLPKLGRITGLDPAGLEMIKHLISLQFMQLIKSVIVSL